MPLQNMSGGGGPWGAPGGGGQGPWGGGSGTPPDLDEVLRKSQDRLKQIFPGGGSGKLLTLIIVGLVAVWLATGFYRVQADEQGVEVLFGKVDRTKQPTLPGLHYFYPAPFGEVLTPMVTRVNRVDVGYVSRTDRRGGRGAPQDVPAESLMLTQDENIVDMDFAVLWRIKNGINYLFNIRDPEGTVKVVAESAMREVVGQTSFDDAVTVGREFIQSRTKALMQKYLLSFRAY